MRIFVLLAFSASLCVAQTEDENAISKIFDALNTIDVSTACKSDLNVTIYNYYERKAWAIASKESSDI